MKTESERSRLADPGNKESMVNMTLIRKQREEDMIKATLAFHSNKRDALSKILKLRQEEIIKQKLKERKRLQWHQDIKKNLILFKQVQTERNRDADKGHERFVHKATVLRHQEIKEFYEKRTKDLINTFKEDHVKFLEKQKIKEQKKLVKEKGYSKTKDIVNSSLLEGRKEDKTIQKQALKLLNILHSTAISGIINLFEKDLRVVYDYYSLLDYDKFTKPPYGWGSGGLLPFRNLCAFANQFNLLPRVMDDIEIRVVYRSVTRGTTVGNMKRGMPIGLTFAQFKELLFRVAVKHKEFFEKIQPPDPSGKPTPQAPMEYVEIMNESFHDYTKIEEEEDKYNEIDDLARISNELKECKKQLLEKLERLRTEYHKLKPREAKQRPKLEEWDSIHQVNEKRRKLREDTIGQNDYQKRQLSTRALKASLIEENKKKRVDLQSSWKPTQSLMHLP